MHTNTVLGSGTKCHEQKPILKSELDTVKKTLSNSVLSLPLAFASVPTALCSYAVFLNDFHPNFGSGRWGENHEL